MVPIRADVKRLEMLSAHADQSELMGWLRGFRKAPERTFVTHGEAQASATFAEKINKDLGWSAEVPSLGDVRYLG